jgi:hypothetical protein
MMSAPERRKAGEHFEDELFFVEPAVLGGGFDHGVFTADVVARHGVAELFFHAPDQVLVAERSLPRKAGAVASGRCSGFLAAC